MIVNEELKKEVARKAAKLKQHTETLDIIIDDVTVTCRYTLFVMCLSIVLPIIIFFFNDASILWQAQVFVQPVFIVTLLSEYRLLHKKQNKYKTIYYPAMLLMSELADLTEWSNLRKRYVLRFIDFPEAKAMDMFISTIERGFSPSRSITNYFILVKNLTALIVVMLIAVYIYYLTIYTGIQWTN